MTLKEYYEFEGTGDVRCDNCSHIFEDGELRFGMTITGATVKSETRVLCSLCLLGHLGLQVKTEGVKTNL